MKTITINIEKLIGHLDYRSKDIDTIHSTVKDELSKVFSEMLDDQNVILNINTLVEKVTQMDNVGLLFSKLTDTERESIMSNYCKCGQDISKNKCYCSPRFDE